MIKIKELKTTALYWLKDKVDEAVRKHEDSYLPTSEIRDSQLNRLAASVRSHLTAEEYENLMEGTKASPEEMKRRGEKARERLTEMFGQWPPKRKSAKIIDFEKAKRNLDR